MKCKGFQYYLDHVAVDLIDKFPFEPKYSYGGSLQLQSNKLCLGLDNMLLNRTAVLTECSEDLKQPKNGTFFILTLNKEIRFKDWRIKCLDSVDLSFYYCHGSEGNQAFIYDPVTLLIKHSKENKCISGRGLSEPIYLAPCDSNADNQKWTWSLKNETLLITG